MFHFPVISKLLQLNSNNLNTDEGIMKFVVDSPTWKHIDTKVDVAFG